MSPASLQATSMNNFVRDAYQSSAMLRSYPQSESLSSSQSSLQKLSPQLFYANTQPQVGMASSSQQPQQQQPTQPQQPQSLAFPPPPPPNMANLVQHSHMIHHQKNDLNNNNYHHHHNGTNGTNSLNMTPLMLNQGQQPAMIQQLAHQHQFVPITHASSINKINCMPANMSQSIQQQTTQIAPLIQADYAMHQPNNNASMHHPMQQQSQQQQYQYLTQQQHITHNQHQQQVHITPSPVVHPQAQNYALPQQQQQLPVTAFMIPAPAASQIQSASYQIQQAAMQAMATNPSQPQILVFVIPQLINSLPSIPPTPDQSTSLNSTLIRQSRSTSSMLRASINNQPSSFSGGSISGSMSVANLSAPPLSSSPVTSLSRTMSTLSVSKQQQQAEPEKFYIKANFSYQATRNKMELSFQKGDILHVLDTLQSSDYGLQYWLATRVKSNGKDSEKGLIPDKNKAEEIVLEQRTQDFSNESLLESSLGSANGSSDYLSVGKVNFLRRKSAQRSKSLCKDNWDNVVFDIGSFKLPVYERVAFKHPGFCRPVVIFGPLADLAREKLLRDYPEKYSYPTGFHQSQDHPKLIRLKGILEVVDQGKHALLDITPSAVEKLNYVNLAPIVIFMKTDSKSIIKEFRSRAAKSLNPSARDEDTLTRSDGKSSRKLLEQSVKLEKLWNHVFTAILNLSTMGSEMWYRKLRETIEDQQSVNVWMGERKSDKKGSGSLSASL